MFKHTIHQWVGVFLVLFLILTCLSCKREKSELVITNTAEVKRMEAIKAAIELEKKEAVQRAARDERLTAEALEETAKAKQLEEETKLAREKLALEKQLAAQKLARERESAAQKKALEDEVALIASASNTINVFVADLRSRQGRLQLKINSLPEEIEEAKIDAGYLTKVLSSCRQGVVTNIRYSVDGKAKIMDVQTVTLKPDEYVKVIKADRKINSILSKYNSEMFAFEMDKVVEELAFENKRLTTSWDLLKKGKSMYGSKQTKANVSVGSTSASLKQDVDKIDKRIKAIEFRIRSLRAGFRSNTTENELQQAMSELGTDGAHPTGLYAEKKRLERMLELSSNTQQQADASSSGIASNFDLQEKSLRDEYESNVRKAFDNVERTVLHVVTGRRDFMEQELISAKDDLASIQLILDAHTKGNISRSDMLSLHSKYTNSVSESLSSAATRILK